MFSHHFSSFWPTGSECAPAEGSDGETCHDVSRLHQCRGFLWSVTCASVPQCCPRWLPWHWQSAPTKISSSGTSEVVAPVTATCTARPAGCYPTGTRWVWNTTAATSVTQTKVLVWLTHSLTRLLKNAILSSSLQRGLLERLPAWFSGQSVQSVYGRHPRGCDQTLRWQPQWALLWQHGSFAVCLRMKHATISSGVVK